MFKEDLIKSWQESIPVFKHIGKWLAYMLGAVLWINLNLLLCNSIGAILVLWIITAVCIIVAIQYHRVVYLREEEERTNAYYAKLDAQWQADYGKPYPR